MKPGFVPGIVRELTVTVTEAMSPAFDGVVVHRCYSTWSVAHHFELAARKVLADFLEDDEEGIGSHVSVDHLAPCPVGRMVRVEALLVAVTNPQRGTEPQHGTEGRDPRVVCDVTAFDGKRLLARGRQVQVVMKKNHLREYIERS